MTKITDWQNCYDSNWKGVITDESFQHPAKFSHGLIRKIYQHLRDEYGLQAGDTVVDPFGGVALGALYAIKAGINWTGSELEEKFVALGQANIDKWNSEYGPHFRPWGRAQLLRGDSRQLAAVISEADGVVGSPPYANSVNQSEGANDTEARIERMRQAGIDVTNRANVGGGNGVARQAQTYGQTPGQLGAMPEGRAIVSSPPYASGEKGHPSLGSVNKDDWGHDGRDITRRRGLTGEYGKTGGQLADMPEGNPAAVVSSPPWAGNSGGRGEASRNGIDPALFDRHQGGMVGGIGGEGNLAGMEPGEVGDVIGAAVVSSPPWENGSEGVMRADKFKDPAAFAREQMNKGHGCSFDAKLRAMEADNDRAKYGDSAGQLGTESGDTFWSAAKQIVLQCADILPPGAPAVWVVKDFVRGGKIIRFSEQWQALCEACGFETVEIVRAWLVKDKGTQFDLNGNGVKKTVARKSFFRRLHEQKRPDLAIDFEIVLFTRRVSQ